MKITKEIDLGGKTFSLETGRFAKQANGAVMARYGDTMVLATVVAAKDPKEGLDYFPLQVEYREKYASAGKIPGGFLKREARPTEKEVLSARLIDRPIRPMFPEWFQCETQVIVTVYSSDQEHDGDVLGAVAASAALMLSDIPFAGPIAEVRVGRIGGQMVINPTYSQLTQSDMDVTVAGTDDSIVMVEGEAVEISEQDMLDALSFAHGYIKQICALQQELAKECGCPKRAAQEKEKNGALVTDIRAIAAEKIRALANTAMLKEDRARQTGAIYEETQKALAEKYGSGKGDHGGPP